VICRPSDLRTSGPDAVEKVESRPIFNATTARGFKHPDPTYNSTFASTHCFLPMAGACKHDRACRLVCQLKLSPA